MSLTSQPLSETPADWKETKDAYVFIAEIPGLEKEEVKVDIDGEGRVLQASGERNADEKEDNDEKNKSKWHRVERREGKFQRRFMLPENVNIDEFMASLQNGVLNVTVPKKVNNGETRIIQDWGELKFRNRVLSLICEGINTNSFY